MLRRRKQTGKSPRSGPRRPPPMRRRTPRIETVAAMSLTPAAIVAACPRPPEGRTVTRDRKTERQPRRARNPTETMNRGPAPRPRRPCDAMSRWTRTDTTRFCSSDTLAGRRSSYYRMNSRAGSRRAVTGSTPAALSSIDLSSSRVHDRASVQAYRRASGCAQRLRIRCRVLSSGDDRRSPDALTQRLPVTAPSTCMPQACRTGSCRRRSASSGRSFPPRDRRAERSSPRRNPAPSAGPLATDRRRRRRPEGGVISNP